MNLAWGVSLLLYGFVMAFTPGPNNLLVASSGLTHGVRRTLPLILGVLAGFLVLMGVAAAGVGALLLADPRLAMALRFAGGAYMLWLAWKLWQARPSLEVEVRPPLRIWHGATLQLVNPKAWMMAVAAVSIYVAPSGDFVIALASVTVLMVVLSFGAMSTWAAFGAGVRARLREPEKVRRVNQVLAVLAALTAVLIVLSDSHG